MKLLRICLLTLLLHVSLVSADPLLSSPPLSETVPTEGELADAKTPAEERWVSACMLAMVNYFGKHVEVSMRAEPPPVPFLEVSDEEKRQFSIFEGGFFGNLFVSNPVAYVCQGTRTPIDDQAPVLQDRVCTRPTGEKTPNGKPVTPCRFILTGPCADSASFTVGSDHYDEVIFVYLKPN
jgi:hypothetical protein